MQYPREEAIQVLRIYNDIPQMIAEEFAVIRNCEAQREKIGVPAAPPPRALSGAATVPAGQHSDRTADFALQGRLGLFEAEIRDRLSRIDELRRQREWARTFLAEIGQNRKDWYILELAYIGPTDPERRRGWRGKSWNEISAEMQISSRTARRRAYKLLDQMMKEKEEKENG